MSLVRYAVIGSGMMGREHLQNLQLLKNAKVTAIYEPDSQQRQLSLALEPQAKIHHSLDSLCKDANIDAFVIASPNHTHFPILKKIITQESRPILVEKPICTTKEDCSELLDLVQRYPAPIWVAMEYRYMPVSQILLKKVHQEKLIGCLHSLSIREHRFPFLKKVANWNRFNANTGGTLVEKCCHFFDLMRLIAGDEVTQVYASGNQDVNFFAESYCGKTPDILDNALVIVEFQSGKRGLLDLCMFCDGSYFQEEICLVGDRGKIEGKIPGPDRLWAVHSLDELGPQTGFQGKSRAAEVIVSPRSPKGPITEIVNTDADLLQAGDHHGGTFYQHQYFYESITSGRKVDVSVEDGVKAVLIGLAAQESIATKSAVALE